MRHVRIRHEQGVLSGRHMDRHCGQAQNSCSRKTPPHPVCDSMPHFPPLNMEGIMPCMSEFVAVAKPGGRSRFDITLWGLIFSWEHPAPCV